MGWVQGVLLGLGPVWVEAGFWGCPQCWDRFVEQGGAECGLVFGPAEGYCVGRCRVCGFVWVFGSRFGRDG